MMLCKNRFIKNYTRHYATTREFPPHKPPNALSLVGWLAPWLNMGVSNKVPSLLPPTRNTHVACCVLVVGDLLHTCNVNAQLNKKSHDITQLFGCISMGLVASHEYNSLLNLGPPNKKLVSLERGHHVAT